MTYMGDFLPDAAIRAAENGRKLEPVHCAFYAKPSPDLDGLVLAYVGLTPRWWDQVIYLLRTHKELTGQALAELLEHGLKNLD